MEFIHPCHQESITFQWHHYYTLNPCGDGSVDREEIGLKNSIFIVTLRDFDKLIGMGRIIGDKGCFYHIMDIAVAPSYQGKGLGKLIMLEINKYLENHVPKTSYVSLIADVPADRLYKKLGFEYSEPKSAGMAKRY